jgi:hypothetical protein|tara:strand:+ start:272 stop:514 length:243 start_codon:yes stop_codon:yes gene_type:complete
LRQKSSEEYKEYKRTLCFGETDVHSFRPVQSSVSFKRREEDKEKEDREILKISEALPARVLRKKVLYCSGDSFVRLFLLF